MLRNLCHGSPHIVQRPKFGYGKRYNDYGLGFYCTDSLEMAKEWGASINQDGYANCYELDCTGLRILDLNSPDFCILHWLSVLLENREFGAGLHQRHHFLPSAQSCHASGQARPAVRVEK